MKFTFTSIRVRFVVSGSLCLNNMAAALFWYTGLIMPYPPDITHACNPSLGATPPLWHFQLGSYFIPRYWNTSVRQNKSHLVLLAALDLDYIDKRKVWRVFTYWNMRRLSHTIYSNQGILWNQTWLWSNQFFWNFIGGGGGGGGFFFLIIFFFFFFVNVTKKVTIQFSGEENAPLRRPKNPCLN